MISNKNQQLSRWITFALLSFFLVKSNLFYWIKGDSLAEIFLWYCNISLLILALGFWRRSPILIGAVFVTSIPAQSAWIFDFILNILGSEYSLNRFSFFETYAQNPNFFNGLTLVLSIVAHAILIPLSGYGVWKVGLKIKSFLFFYYFYLSILLPISYWLGSPKDNINCMHILCGDVDTIGLPLHIQPLKQMIECFLLITILFWGYLIIRHYYCFVKKEDNIITQKYLDPPSVKNKKDR